MQKKKHHLFAAAFMTISMFFLGGAIFGIKKFADAPRKQEKLTVTDFNLSKIKKIKQKKDSNKIKKKVQKMRKRMKALKPVLSANLSGQSFGLDLGDMGKIDLDKDLLEGDGDVVMDENSVDSKPRIMDRPAVEFPEKALADNIMKGMVEIRMLINKEGRVENVEVLSANPTGYFEDSALAMVQGWSFDPATYKGKRVAMWAKQVVKFGE